MTDQRLIDAIAGALSHEGLLGEYLAKTAATVAARLSSKVIWRDDVERVGWFKAPETLHGEFVTRHGTSDTYEVEAALDLSDEPLSELWQPVFVLRAGSGEQPMTAHSTRG